MIHVHLLSAELFRCVETVLSYQVINKILVNALFESLAMRPKAKCRSSTDIADVRDDAPALTAAAEATIKATTVHERENLIVNSAAGIGSVVVGEEWAAAGVLRKV